MPRVTVRGDIGFPGHPVAKNVDICFESGGLNCILGPNGSGKTTLLLTIGGALKPLKGRVEITPNDATRIYVPPSPPLLPGFRVGDVLLYLMSSQSKMTVYDTRINPRVCEEVLEELGFNYHLDRYFDELSTGEKQKVVLAGAIASSSSILLLDEPNSHLDLKSRTLLYRILKREASKRLVIAALHDVNEACMYCDKVVLMGRGRVLGGPGHPSDMLCLEKLEEAYGISFEPVEHKGRILYFPSTSST